MLAWNDFGRQNVSIVMAPSNINSRTIGISSSINCISRQWVVAWKMTPFCFLITNKNFILQTWVFDTSIRKVNASMTRMNFSRCQRTFMMSSADLEIFAVGGFSTYDSSVWCVAICWCDPSETTTGKIFKVIFRFFNSIVGDITSLLAWNYFCW